MKLSKYVDQVATDWKSFAIFYVTTLFAIFLGLWTIAGPFDIPAMLPVTPLWLRYRLFWHISITMLLASHLTLLVELLYRKRLSKIINGNQIARQMTKKFVLIIAANTTGTVVINKIANLGYTIKGVYDKNLQAGGIKQAREKSLAIYTGGHHELRNMLNLCLEYPEHQFYIFLTTENHNFVLSADEVIRSLRTHAKNFNYYRLGIDFEATLNETDVFKLLS